MKITNKLNLPKPIVEAIKNDSYSASDCDISITALIDPPRKVVLQERHWNEIEEDASDRIWALVGQVMHGILERADDEALKEHRFYANVEGWRVSGQIDRYIDGRLQDYKFVTAWKLKKGVPPEYVKQLNCYAYLLRENNHPVQKLQLCAILRDWSKLEAARDPEYPQQQVVMMEVPMWSHEEAQKFIRERVILHKQATLKLPECTPEERWAKPRVFAVKQKGKDRAIRLYATRTEAEIHAETNSNFYIEERPGASQRCEHYCAVSEFCEQWKKLNEET